MFDQASQRYVRLVEQLAEERGHRYGWRSEVARLLNVHPSYISRIAAGEQTSVGREAIERAVERLGLAPGYFSAAGEADYRKHLTSFDSSGNPQALTHEVSSSRVDALRRKWEELDAAGERFANLAAPSVEDAAELARLVLELPLVNDARVVLERAAGDGLRADAVQWGYGVARGIRDTVHGGASRRGSGASARGASGASIARASSASRATEASREPSASSRPASGVCTLVHPETAQSIAPANRTHRFIER